MTNREYIKTTFLLQELKESTSIYEYLKANHGLFAETAFSEYLNQIIRNNKISKAELVSKSGLSKSYAYALLSGERKPSTRNRVISLAFCVNATLDETQNLLAFSEFHILSPKVQRDSAVIFALEQGLDYYQLLDLLFDLNLEGME